MNKAQEYLDEIHDGLVNLQESDDVELLFQALRKFNYDIIDMFDKQKRDKIINHIQKRIKLCINDLESIDKMAREEAIERVRRGENLGNNISDEEIERDYESEVDEIYSDIRWLFERDFAEEWEDIISLAGDFRDEYDLERKIRDLDEPVFEYLDEVEQHLPDLVKEQIMEIFEE